VSRAAFLTPDALIAGGPNRFVTQVERALLHLGFDDVRNIDGSGDMGGDILALKGRERWAIQVKWRKAGPVGKIDREGVDQVDLAQRYYQCEHAMLVTNAYLDGPAQERLERLNRAAAPIALLDAPKLDVLADDLRDRIPSKFSLRDYQHEAVAAINTKLADDGRALLVLATGLGKSVVGGTVIGEHLDANPNAQVLVVAHMKDLVAQLEKSLWSSLPKTVPTHLLTGEIKPTGLDGVVCATVESALGAVRHGYRPDLVMVDETHHVAESGMFSDLLDELPDAQQFGVTATPWRGDKYDIEDRFGKAVYKLGIADGMNCGYLAQVNYQLFLDNIDWHIVEEASRHGHSLKELNRKLFVPDRDAAIIDRLLTAWHATPGARVIVFCESVAHAEHFRNLLRQSLPAWQHTEALHSQMPKRDRDIILAKFRRGDVPILCAVDVLNEGIDVPDVNIIAFMRVTHSRRIFIQQLGRGLRVRAGKDRVTVLDFVSDIRRIAAVLQLKRDLSGDEESVRVPWPSEITFSDANAQTLMEEWIEDAASLETANDEAKLDFPDPGGI
jgi:superfamily II DNA or RNA helicase